MKKLFFSGIITMCSLFISSTGFAQSEERSSKNMNNEEIIIRTDGDSTQKAIIEIEGNSITVNGEPLEEYDGDIQIRKRKTMIANGDNFLNRPEIFFNLNKNESKAFLGVLTAKNELGALIKEVTGGSSAAKASLEENDIITNVDEKKINNPADLAKAIRSHQPGDEVSIQFLRNGKTKTFAVVLGKRDNLSSFLPNNDFSGWQNFKYKMPEISKKYFKYFDDSQPKLGITIQNIENEAGVKVLNVEEGSIAEKAGLKIGDVIIEMNDDKIDGVDEAIDEIDDTPTGEPFKIKVLRNNTEVTIDVNFPKKLKSAKL